MNEPGSSIGPGRKSGSETPRTALRHHYLIRFRTGLREYTACADNGNFSRGDLVMVQREQGLEPATIGGRIFALAPSGGKQADCPEIVRLATEDEQRQLQLVLMQEQEAFAFCQQQVGHLQLIMHLVRVERFFNGSKINFYFTAENRVDFRELVKVLVQQYRTRIEMRQIGVRHETQMLGGLGACGRELCCSTFLNEFDSVSIKMAKAQDLPLNPTKISGICNRLLCCLTYEYESYKTMKRQMPNIGRVIRFNGIAYQVSQQHPLAGSLTVTGPDGSHKTLREEEWRQSEDDNSAGGVKSQDAEEKADESQSGPPPRQGRRRKHVSSK